MSLRKQIQVLRVDSAEDRNDALEVMRAIYRDEKNWVQADERLVSEEDLKGSHISWFLARVGRRPVGVLRVLYELPLDLYREYGFKMLSASFDADEFLKSNRVAEIGRFAVLPEFRGNIFVVTALMRAAVFDTVERGFTHYITDVFEGEEHSPYEFHTRVMGFVVVATHDTGELNCPNRRLTMLLDLAAGYRRLKSRKNWIFRYLTADWSDEMHTRLEEKEDSIPLVAAVK